MSYFQKTANKIATHFKKACQKMTCFGNRETNLDGKSVEELIAKMEDKNLDLGQTKKLLLIRNFLIILGIANFM